MKLITIPTLLMIAVAVGSNAHAHGMGPMILENSNGSLVISNRLNRSIRVSLQAYPVNEINGRKGPSEVPYSEEDQDKLVRLSKSMFRVRREGFKTVKYRIKSTSNSTPFYICSSSIQGSFSTRVCSFWEG